MSGTSGCSPFRLGLNVIDIVPDSSVWDFGDGKVGKGNTVFNIYNDPGTFTIKVKIYNNGVETVLTKKVTVYKSPSADFEFTPNSGCPPLFIQFKDKSTIGNSAIKEWTWDFGNGKSIKGLEKNPSITYVSSAERDIALVIEDNNGCKSTRAYPKAIKILPTPFVDFEFTNSNSCALPVIASFKNKSTSALNLTYEWSFGDGGTSTDIQPTHTYTKEGDFPIKLIAKDENKCVSEIVKNNFIVDENFNIAIKLSDSVGCDLLNISYEPVISSLYRSLKWTFDPVLKVDKDKKTIKCDIPGIYPITLESTSQFGCTVSVTRNVYVSKSPTADFIGTPTLSCKAPQEVLFTNKSTGAVSYAWNFGDGGSSTLENPTKVYNSYRTYPVRLIATDEYGCANTIYIKDYISVLKPVVEIEASNSFGCIPLTTSFKMNTLNGFTIKSIQWNFDNGSTSNAINPPSQTFTIPRKYNITAIVSFKEACDDIIVKKTIDIGSELNFNASISSTEICPSVLLKGQADNIPGAQYEWSIGSSEKLKTRTISYKFIESGSFNVSVSVNLNGCKSFKSLGKVNVKETAADFNLVSNCSGKSLTFRNDKHANVKSTWDFGDGNIVVDNNRIVTHEFKTFGTFKVKLSVVNSKTGCTDEIIKDIEVKKKSGADFVLTPIKGCAPLEVNYQSLIGSSSNYWTINDSTYTGSRLEDIFDKAGTYDLIYRTVKDGCKDSLFFKDLIQVVKPEAGFEFDPIGGCAPINVNFKDTSSSTLSKIVKYNWDLAGLGSNTNKQFSESFSITAILPISLAVEDDFGCKDTVKHDLVVAYPNVKFNIPSKSFCTGNNFKPENLSTGVGLKYFWDFGDGSPINNDSAPKHVYQNEGVYNISLKIIDANNCSDSLGVKNAVTISEVKYDFDGYPRNKICPELLTNFEIVPANIVYRRTQWDFGNGNSSDDTSRYPTNLYLEAGTYDVTLTLEDYRGCVDVITKEKFIDIGGPSGKFVVSDTAACAPLEVTMQADIRNSIANFWDFDDGSGAYDTTASSKRIHTYTSPGVYRPSVTADDGLGCIATVFGPYIRVGGPTANISASADIVCNGEELMFADTSLFDLNAPFNSRNWILSDGFSSTDSNFVHQFQTSDSADVFIYLTVVDSLGCKDTDTLQIGVFAKAPLKVKDKFIICKGDSIQLKSSGVHHYEWQSSGTLSNLNINNPIAFPLQTTEYQIRGSVSPTCFTDKTVLVEVVNAVTGTAGPDTIICIGNEILLQANMDTIDSGKFIYNWYQNNVFLDSVIPLKVSPNLNTTYILNVKNGSCKEINLPVFVEVKEYPSLTVVESVKIFKGQQANLESYSDEGVSYSWSPTQNLSCTNCPFPTASISSSMVYTVTATNAFGCSISEDIEVNVIESCDENLIQIQNVFSPNQDGINDNFTLRNNDFLQLERIRIYSRSGELVYESANISDSWDGTYNGSVVNSGVYVYYIEAKCATGDPIMLKGNITLLK
ncbi:MAG TPA: PKD domain-containing protein [Chitinophagales bacterium]|nr:PKD domain-containing protein [Chitinophagales bacterium]